MNFFRYEVDPSKISNVDWWNLNAFLRQKIESDSGRAWLFFGFAMLCVIIPYLIGSINPAILISKLVYHDDIRNHGSGNAGSTNMLRTYGKKAAVATMTLDFLKAIIATVLGTIFLGYDGMAIGGLFVGVGHMFPLYYKFKGGKGVACFAMVALVMHPFVFLALIATFLIIVIGTRYVSMASVAAAFMFPLYVRAFVPHNNLCMAATGLAACLVIYMHRENLKRIWKNEEPKLDFSKKKKKRKQAEEEETSEVESDE